MAKLILLVLLFGCGASADQIEHLGQVSFDSSHKFEKTRFGGISGLVWDDSDKVLWALTDDRGKLNPPRVYKMKLEIKTTPKKPVRYTFDLKTEAVFEVKETGRSLPVFDFEGIALLPWGNLLLSSEGDDGSRPRRAQRLLDVKIITPSSEEALGAKAAGLPVEKSHGQVIRDYDLPKWYIPESTGQPTQGLRTNLGFEGLAMSLDNKALVAAAEGQLTQDTTQRSRLLRYEIGAFTMTLAKEWSYPLDTDGPSGPWLLRGVSEILPVEEDRWWVMERGLQLGVPPLTTQIYEVELKDGLSLNPLPTKPTFIGDLPELKKKRVLDLDHFGPTPMTDNFEAMTWGPPLADGRRLLILANDNNFQKGSATYFVFAAVKLERPSKRDPSKDGSTHTVEAQKR